MKLAARVSIQGLSFSLSGLTLVLSPPLQASGFQLVEQSASGQGLSYAGAAAERQDVSSMWFNPAVLSNLASNQIALAGHVIAPTARFSNNGSTGPVAPGTGGFLSGSGDDGATVGFVPNLYWAQRFGNHTLGLGINVPFGQHISYDEDWAGRYHATETDLKTVNINPAWSTAINDQWQIGLGLNAQYVDVVLEQKINQSALGAEDGNAKVTGDSWALGWNAGIMFQPLDRLNMGLAYRSQVQHDVQGKVDYQGIDSAVSGSLYDMDASSSVTMPASASLAVDYHLAEKWQLLASTTWTQWSAYDELVMKYENGNVTNANQNFKDSWRYSLGTVYHASDALRLRTGLAYDNTPVPDKTHRSPRNPDVDRRWFSVGLGYDLAQDWTLDLGYSHLWADKAKVDYAQTNDLGTNTLKGEYDTAVNIFSAQMVWRY
ncbi:MAG: outer membrane protein transport protein [Hydrogenovibrio sp.]|uniref:OmpP1/FadL family transporter n=1 Tax=Hydrogenovibrio sp. TaxID=2065821 RepID=UPI0028708C9B|nr:outer membrane protein transport protein [Hydrogenovibrio sp.]MDR9498241.1 outer membrane protein transport protein [Hydrogenovibrio sp.]